MSPETEAPRVVVPPSSNPELEASSLVERANEAEKDSRFDDAEACYRAATALAPNHVAAIHGLAFSLHRRGEVQQAEQLVRKALALKPREPILSNTLGIFLKHQGRYAEAEASYRLALALKPNYADAHYNLGILLEAVDRGEEALVALKAAAALQPDHVQALTRIAAILLARGDTHEALRSATRAVELDPNYFDAAYYRGWILSSLQRPDEALASFRAAAKLKPGNVEASLATANALRDAGRHDEAIECYRQVLEQQPGRGDIHVELNRLAWLSGRQDMYLSSFAEARKREPANIELYTLEAAFHLRRDDYVAAEEVLRAALARAPSSGAVVGMLARAIAGQGRIEASEPLFLRAIEAEPDSAVHRQELGFTLLNARRPDDAAHAFASALERNRNDQLALAGLTLALRMQGDAHYRWLVDHDRYVRSYDLPVPPGFRDPASFNALLADELDRLHTTKIEPIDQSLRGGTQTIGRLFESRGGAVEQLRVLIEEAVSDYISKLPEDSRHPVSGRRSGRYGFAGSWSCRLQSGGFHRNHVHPAGWISSAYYARLPSSVDSQTDAGWLSFGQSQYLLGDEDVSEALICPAVGKLVLFPSYYWHGTKSFLDGDRLTVAFDVVPA